MSIGTKIKALRRAKDLTQEELAEVLGVTSKAVSQWECNRTAPDISQVPILCNFFNVTADELLEIDIFQKQAELEKIIEKSLALARNGKLEECIFTIKEGLKRFPNDARLMSFLINDSITYVHTRNCSEEENEKAWEYAGKLPLLTMGREFVYPDLNTGTEKALSDQNLKQTLLHFFAIRMLANYQLDSGEWLYTEDERMDLRKKKFALFDVLYEQGDYGFFSEHLAESHEMQARCFAGKQNKEKCLYHLDKAADYAIAFIDYMKTDTFLHTSLLWKGFDNPGKHVSLSERENTAAMILARLECEEYDFMREDKEFGDVLGKLAEVAGENDY